LVFGSAFVPTLNLAILIELCIKSFKAKGEAKSFFFFF